jgi:hypothetical protein
LRPPPPKPPTPHPGEYNSPGTLHDLLQHSTTSVAFKAPPLCVNFNSPGYCVTPLLSADPVVMQRYTTFLACRVNHKLAGGVLSA